MKGCFKTISSCQILDLYDENIGLSIEMFLIFQADMLGMSSFYLVQC